MTRRLIPTGTLDNIRNNTNEDEENVRAYNVLKILDEDTAQV